MDYQDRIGDRLNHPDAVPPQYRHLIPDDRQRVEWILSIPVSGRVLDVGCSDGAITRRIAKRWGVEAVGIDMRTWSGTLVPAEAVTFLQHDIRDPLLLGVFDAIYACEVFEHLTDADADKALQNILAALKLGGDLIVTVPNRFPNDLYEVSCRSRWAWPDHKSAWALSKLDRWLRPRFEKLEHLPLYDGDSLQRISGAGLETLRVESDSIWLICHAKGKR